MARAILLVGAVLWLLAGAAFMVVALLGTDALEGILPPLAIDTDALRGAILAVAGALLLGGLLHVGVLVGVRAGRPRAWTGGILLATVLAALFVALSAAAFTSAAAEPMHWLPWLVLGVGASVAAGCYALAAVRLVAELRAGSAF